MGFLIDTCIWIDVERGSIAPADVSRYTANEPVFISPVTLSELAFGAEMAVTEPIHQKRLASLNRLRKKPFVIIDNNTGEVFGRLAAYLRREGKDHRYRVQDLWLASSLSEGKSKKVKGKNKSKKFDLFLLFTF